MCLAYRASTLTCKPHLREKEKKRGWRGGIQLHQEGKLHQSQEGCLNQISSSYFCTTPSIWMFLSSTGLTIFAPTVTPVVLQYSTFVPDFNVTCVGEKAPAVNTRPIIDCRIDLTGFYTPHFSKHVRGKCKTSRNVQVCKYLCTVPCVWPTFHCLSVSSISYQKSCPFLDTGHSESVTGISIINEYPPSISFKSFKEAVPSPAMVTQL